MRIQANDKNGVAVAARKRKSAVFSPFNRLIRLWVLGAILTWQPGETHASTQRPIKKESTTTAKGSSNAAWRIATPVKRLTKIPARPALLRQPSLPPIDTSDRREHIVHRTRLGDKLSEILNRFNLTASEKQFWKHSINQNFSGQPLAAGREIHFYLNPAVVRGRHTMPAKLKALELDLNDSATLTWERSVRGVLFQRHDKPFDVELKTISTVVKSSLVEDGRKAGIHPTLLSQLTDIFTFDIDLEKEIQSGDSVKILYEKRSRRGQEARGSLRILAAELVNAGQKLTAIYFEKQKGQGNYYNLEGRSLARSFLRFPLEFANITSQFSDNRFNPLLRVNMPHTGVDFAAQRGTPVRAVGDGVIAEAGWNGAYGKAIDLKHDSTFMSRYAHLDTFAEGIQPGASVKKSQVIGYVGSTGRSTGPHLHFELYKDNQYVDPLGVNFPAEDEIEPALQKIFDTQLKTYLVELSSADKS